MQDIKSKDKKPRKQLGFSNGRQPEKKEDKKEEKKEKILVSWSAAEYDKAPDRGPAWYWVSLIIASALIIFALWQNNLLFAVFIVIAWLLVVGMSESEPKTWAFAVSENGITIGDNKRYSWNEIAGFDIHEASGVNKALLVKTTHTLMPIIRINIPKEKEQVITDTLLRFVKKEEYAESLMDILMRVMRF